MQSYPSLKAVLKFLLVSVKPGFSSLALSGSHWSQWEVCTRNNSRYQGTFLQRLCVINSLLLKLGGGKHGVLLLSSLVLPTLSPLSPPSKHLAQISVSLFDQVQKSTFACYFLLLGFSLVSWLLFTNDLKASYNSHIIFSSFCWRNLCCIWSEASIPDPQRQYFGDNYACCVTDLSCNLKANSCISQKPEVICIILKPFCNMPTCGIILRL